MRVTIEDENCRHFEIEQIKLGGFLLPFSAEHFVFLSTIQKCTDLKYHTKVKSCMLFCMDVNLVAHVGKNVGRGWDDSV